MDPVYFETAEDFRAWLAEHHEGHDELWVGYYKKATGVPSITWPESVDQALCFGWIDGLRKRIDDERYKIRFTPRRPDSIWSRVNMERLAELREQGLVEPAGLAAFDRRTEERSKRYSYERETAELGEDFEQRLRAQPDAWEFFQSLSPYNLRASCHWVMSAKREATRERRFAVLLESCREGRPIPQLRRD